MNPFNPNILQPFDCLLYRPSDVMGCIIAVKTWTRVSHVEVYMGKGQSMAARSEGVNLYPLRTAQLGFVLRMNEETRAQFDERKAYDYALSVCGQRYDRKGLLCFSLAEKQGAVDRQFCSELGTNIYRKGGARPFAASWSADRVAPGQYLQTPMFKDDFVWCDGGIE